MKFPRPDLSHEFVYLSAEDKVMLEKGKEVMAGLGGKRDAVFWYCLRYWIDQQYKEETSEKIFGKKQTL